LFDEKKKVAGATTTLTAAASDNVGVAGVRFYVNGIAVDPEKTTYPFTANWVPASGTSTIVAVARDSAGNYASSSPILIFVSAPPVVLKPVAVLTPTPASTATTIFTKFLSFGTKHDEIKKLQEYLAQDKSIYPEGLVTGYYGLLTQSAIQKFQCKYNIVCEGTSETTGYGNVGPKTRAKLNELYPSQTYLEALLPSSTATTSLTALRFTKHLYLGLKHEQVFVLQQFLAKDKTLYPEGFITGYYGQLTQTAIQRFQCKYNIVCEGIPETTGYGQVGPKTRAKLNELMK